MPKPRSPRSALVNAIDQSRWPNYLLDSDLRLVWGNESLQHWLGEDWSHLLDRALDQLQDIPTISGKQWARALLPPAHSRARPDLAFSVASPATTRSESDRSLPNVDDEPSDEIFQGRVSRLATADHEWFLVVLSPASLESTPLPSRLRELHGEWERTQRHEADEAADLFAGDSALAQRLREQAMLAARMASRVAIVGPPGSGHESIAQWILHHRPESTRGPIATLECTLLDAELLQSSFRDLVRESRGADAPSGCLVLLSVDRLSESGQLELLNLLRFPKVPVGTIVTSHVSLEKLVDAGAFDSELATRLGVMKVEIPALKDRPEDLPLLAHATLQRAAEANRAEVLGWTDAALVRLQRHAWPNNFEELQALAKRLSAQCEKNWLSPNDLPRWLGTGVGLEAEEPRFHLKEFRLEEFLRQCETEIMQIAIKQCRGNKTKAARLLGLSRGGFHRRWEALSSDADRGEGAELENAATDESSDE